MHYKNIISDYSNLFSYQKNCHLMSNFDHFWPLLIDQGEYRTCLPQSLHIKFMDFLHSKSILSLLFVLTQSVTVNSSFVSGAMNNLQASLSNGSFDSLGVNKSVPLESSTDFCKPVNPCLNGGVCSSTPTGAKCGCLANGYSGPTCASMYYFCWTRISQKLSW